MDAISTISKSDEYISVEEEIENLKNYMYINEIRYGEKIKTEIGRASCRERV